MELYKGLPHRTIHIEGKTMAEDKWFGISTEEVGTLLNHFFDNSIEIDSGLEEFDNSTAYFVPEEIFLSEDDETVIEFIKQNIDENVTG